MDKLNKNIEEYNNEYTKEFDRYVTKAMMDIEEAYGGFDWEAGSFILQPEKPLVSWEYLEKYHPGIREEIEQDRKRYVSRPIRCIFAGSRACSLLLP